MFSLFRKVVAADSIPYTYEAWKKRVEQETPLIREAFLSVQHDNRSYVVELGDLVWWPYVDRVKAYILAGVRLNTGRCLALGYDNSTFMEPLDSTGKAWAFKNCSHPPSLKLCDDAVMVSITSELALMAMYSTGYGTHKGPHTWRYRGQSFSGDAARRKFKEHGFRIDNFTSSD